MVNSIDLDLTTEELEEPKLVAATEALSSDDPEIVADTKENKNELKVNAYDVLHRLYDAGLVPPKLISASIVLQFDDVVTLKTVEPDLGETTQKLTPSQFKRLVMALAEPPDMFNLTTYEGGWREVPISEALIPLDESETEAK